MNNVGVVELFYNFGFTNKLFDGRGATLSRLEQRLDRDGLLSTLDGLATHIEPVAD